MLDPDANNELNTQIQYRLIEKLTQSERRYRELVENLREIVFECDRQGTLTFLNRAWEETLGYSTQSSIGKGLGDFIHPLSSNQWQAALCTQTDTNMVLKFVHQSGHCLWLELSMRVRANGERSGSLIDITERRQAAQILQQANEELENRVKQRTAELSQVNQDLTQALEKLQCTQGQLIQTEKMSSLGQLVAGIAHEINNPVNFVYGNLDPAHNYVRDILHILDLYQTHYPKPVPIIQTELDVLDIAFLKTDFPKLIESMRMGAKRIQDIVLSLRNFSRLDEAGVKTVNIHDGLENTLLILNNRLKGKKSRTPPIHLVKHYGDLPAVECFPGELNQVFMNILTNAIDVLEQDQSSVSHPTDSTTAQQQQANAIAPHTPHNPHVPHNPHAPYNPHNLSPYEPIITIETHSCGDRVLIAISDNGPGVSTVHVPKLFDPFFTTKPVGKGTGLGLSISHQIITERHGGELNCHSKIGKGTTFEIKLPLQIT